MSTSTSALVGADFSTTEVTTGDNTISIQQSDAGTSVDRQALYGFEVRLGVVDGLERPKLDMVTNLRLDPPEFLASSTISWVTEMDKRTILDITQNPSLTNLPAYLVLSSQQGSR